MPQKSIFRQPGAKHFQLVHRSQRDPLIHDPDASQHVLKPYQRENLKKGNTRKDLESSSSLDGVDQEYPSNIGEAAQYGIYYDDTEYDYMQHLRQVGAHEEGVESVLVEAPPNCPKSVKKRTNGGAVSLRDIPAEAFASPHELLFSYESQEAVPSSIAGFQPDMDPHSRQVLDALEDDAFIDDELQDGFFQELVAGGEREAGEGFEFDFQEGGQCGEDEVEKDLSWESRFRQFKEQKLSVPAADSDSDVAPDSEGGDTVGTLPRLPVIGGRRRRKGTSNASGYSMSSSSMTRTEALQTLDERFDQMILKEYRSDEESSGASSLDDDDAAPQLIPPSRQDFEEMVDDFLDNYEILGKKMRPKLDGDNSAAKLETLRRTLGQDDRVRIRDDESDDDMVLLADQVDEVERWDCETILSTYSNLENHPRLILARQSDFHPKIKLNTRTQSPTAASQEANASQAPIADKLSTVTRPKNEPKEEKRVRKQAVKAERQARRIEKKATKEQFSAEFERQKNDIVSKGQSKTRKL